MQVSTSGALFEVRVGPSVSGSPVRDVEILCQASVSVKLIIKLKASVKLSDLNIEILPVKYEILTNSAVKPKGDIVP